MSDEEHGIDPSIQHHDDKIVIKLQVPGTNHKQEFALETEPFEWQKALVSRGTCCYRNIDKKFVVKFSWRMTGRNSEAELLKLTTNVVGMAKLLGWRHLETIGNLQKGLEFTRQMVKDCRPKEKLFATPTVFVEKQVSVPKKSTSKTVVQKRKSESNYCGGINGSASKRARSSKNVTTRSIPVVEICSRSTRPAQEPEHPHSADGSPAVPKKASRRSSRIHERQSNQFIGERRSIPEESEVYDRVKRLHLSSTHRGATASDVVGSVTSRGTDVN
ncbi:Bgt-50660 [Blumeria graminis f. sp. tritici]|uniref:Bgt-50660 n=1 Tax=Blumeria graminis f. sp. tritici TaxID=62690 RepID=A0A9X9LBG4_BLUGR|nr:Bgt-50660 [Blumeria graminis f. sp. tritici]